MRTATGIGTYALISCVAAGLGAWLTLRRVRDPLPPPSQPSSVQSAASAVDSDPPVRASQSGEPPGLPTPLTADLPGICPVGMLLVRGDYCAKPLPCSEPECRPECGVGNTRLLFCIDRFEYPNVDGTLPAVMATFDEARAACAVEQKRLCRDVEWTFACAGPDDATAPESCSPGESIRWPAVDETWTPRSITSRLDRFDRRRASGSESSCRSPWGAIEMLGNVQEWAVANLEGWGALKGSHVGADHVGCRASTNTRNLSSRYLHTGFRCCADPDTGKPR